MSAQRLAIISTHGSLDAAYPPFILATAAVAMDMEAGIFFTFYGLEILKKGNIDKLQVSPIANPAMPQPVPGISVPNILGVLPGMTAVATNMMNGWMKKSQRCKTQRVAGNVTRDGCPPDRLPDEHGCDGYQKRRLDRWHRSSGGRRFPEICQ